ncbi:hypothetical protein OIDMADRAFT_148308 [Oidiodendron maius Zn]|uniref:Uncharacterized protein n=1 Tax=Oidiodendron maius (strain Zn) TaxID=913774 RepID=A0A0C3D3E3_OIDMZ|nr:hypothetical protein OIDMADRAFT_148308 [Oidiodendron maius Zn]
MPLEHPRGLMNPPTDGHMPAKDSTVQTKDSPRSKPRRRPLVDGLEHLYPNADPPTSQKLHKSRSISLIASDLIYLEMWAYQLVREIKDLQICPLIEDLLGHYARICEDVKPATFSTLDPFAKATFERARNDLRSIYDLALTLRGHISEAVTNLDKHTLNSLKSKMSVLQSGFLRAGEILNKRPCLLINEESDTWWDPLSPSRSKLGKTFNPKVTTVNAYPQAPSTQPTLIILVTTLSLVSLVTTFLSFVHSTPSIGTTSDADFWQLVSSSIMQISSIASMVMPVYQSIRLTKEAWFWTWILAGVGFCSAVAAVPLYLYLPVKWSDVVSFAGTLAQSYVTLQLVYAI